MDGVLVHLFGQWSITVLRLTLATIKFLGLPASESFSEFPFSFFWSGAFLSKKLGPFLFSENRKIRWIVVSSPFFMNYIFKKRHFGALCFSFMYKL